VVRRFLEQFFVASNWRVVLPCLLRELVTQAPGDREFLEHFVRAQWNWARDSLRRRIACTIDSIGVERRGPAGEVDLNAAVTFSSLLAWGEEEVKHTLFQFTVEENEVVDWNAGQIYDGAIMPRPWRSAIEELEADTERLHQRLMTPPEASSGR
jgi:hypothetical protein